MSSANDMMPTRWQIKTVVTTMTSINGLNLLSYTRGETDNVVLRRSHIQIETLYSWKQPIDLYKKQGVSDHFYLKYAKNRRSYIGCNVAPTNWIIHCTLLFQLNGFEIDQEMGSTLLPSFPFVSETKQRSSFLISYTWIFMFRSSINWILNKFTKKYSITQ